MGSAGYRPRGADPRRRGVAAGPGTDHGVGHRRDEGSVGALDPPEAGWRRSDPWMTSFVNAEAATSGGCWG